MKRVGWRRWLVAMSVSAVVFGCDSNGDRGGVSDGGDAGADTVVADARDPDGSSADAAVADDAEESEVVADVQEVSVSGSPGDYTFSVTVSSPDTGCEQYADWWEVVTPEGELVYRRILGHSHTDEQPFTRSGLCVGVGGGRAAAVRVCILMEISGVGGRSRSLDEARRPLSGNGLRVIVGGHIQGASGDLEVARWEGLAGAGTEFVGGVGVGGELR